MAANHYSRSSCPVHHGKEEQSTALYSIVQHLVQEKHLL